MDSGLQVFVKTFVGKTVTLEVYIGERERDMTKAEVCKLFWTIEVNGPEQLAHFGLGHIALALADVYEV